MGKRGKSKSTGTVDRPAIDAMEDPDPEADDYYTDKVEQFYHGRNKVLLDQGHKDDDESDIEEEDAVLDVISEDDLLSSENDDDEIRMYRAQLRHFRDNSVKETMDSDLEEEVRDNRPDSRAWGSKKQRFYNTDVIDDRFDLSGSDEETGKAVMEETEALAIQRRLAEEIEEGDFGLDMFADAPKEADDKEKDGLKIAIDLSQLSRREKLELLKKESPELIALIEDYRNKLTEVKEVFEPLLKFVNNNSDINPSAVEYVKTRYSLNMNYCVNVSFYLVLKAKHVAAQEHPVVKRMVAYRNLLKQLEPLDESLKSEVTDLLERLKRGEILSVQKSKAAALKAKAKKKTKKVEIDAKTKKLEVAAKSMKRKKSVPMETSAEREALEFYEGLKKKARFVDNEEDDNDVASDKDDADTNEQDADGKRAITYQMAQNKNLVGKKKKKIRNPRIKHRKKYEQAKIRRKGQVREVHTEVSRYGGELTGIKSGSRRGTKLQ